MIDADRLQIELERVEEEAKRYDRWPLPIIFGGMALSIAVGDTINHTSGMATGVFGIGGLCAIAYGLAQRHHLRKAWLQEVQIRHQLYVLSDGNR